MARFFNTVGPRQTGRYGMVLPNFVRQALKGNPITVYGDGKQSRCFCYVGDVVAALIGLIQKPEAIGQVFNIGSTEEISIEGLAALVKEKVGSTSPISYVPYDQAYEEGFEDMVRRIPSIEKISKCIGWRPVTPLSATVDSIIQYFQQRDTEPIEEKEQVLVRPVSPGGRIHSVSRKESHDPTCSSIFVAPCPYSVGLRPWGGGEIDLVEAHIFGR